MKRKPENFIEVIDVIKKVNLDKNVVIIGSWCEMFYETLFDKYQSNMRTNDIDFYYHEVKKPKLKLNFISEMEEIGYFAKESIYPQKTKFVNGDLEVEFLTRKTRNLNPSEKIEAIDIYAECLEECAMFGSEKNIMNCYIKEYNIEMLVPTPVAYAMHKILINDARKLEKQQKDKESIYRLIPFIENSEEYMKDWERIYNNFSKKEKRRFNKNLQTLKLDRLLK